MTAQFRIPADSAFSAHIPPFRSAVALSLAFDRLVSEWRRRIRERNELRKLSDRDLADFMCGNADACAEAGKWFWEA